MYRVISNKESLLQWESETGNRLELWKNISAINRIREMVSELDNCYGADRDIEADLGGYIIVIYGEESQVTKDFKQVLEYHCLQEDSYEFEETYTEAQDKLIIRLYLCSNDYAVVTVLEEK